MGQGIEERVGVHKWIVSRFHEAIRATHDTNTAVVGSQGEKAMKRCAHCNGKFGLTRHRWYNLAFCRKRCRENYLDELARDRDRLKHWFGFLARATLQQR